MYLHFPVSLHQTRKNRQVRHIKKTAKEEQKKNIVPRKRIDERVVLAPACTVTSYNCPYSFAVQSTWFAKPRTNSGYTN